MANRFERMYELPGNLYVNGSPIIISAAALLKDTETGNVLVQLKLHSVSDKGIKALKISISAFDISGKPLPGVEDYQFLDLNIFNGQYFGSQKAIIMPEAVTRVFSISAFTVVFEDLSTWVWDKSVALEPISKQQPLFNVLQSEDLVVQYQLTTSEHAKFKPAEFDSLWLCSCGEANSGTTCTSCRVPKSVIFSALNKDNLSVELEKRLSREQKLREEEIERQRISAEQAAAKKAAAKEKRDKLFKWAKIAAIPLAVVLLAIIVFSAVGRNNKVLTLDKVLAFETKEDVVSFLGKPGDADGGDSYDVSFIGDDYLALFYYDDDGFLSNCTLSYFFEGAKDIKKATDLLDYVPTDEDISIANDIVAHLLDVFAKKFGEQERFDSSVGTTTYTWFADTTQIELVDSIANEDISLIGAVDLRFIYNVAQNQAECGPATSANLVEDAYNAALALAQDQGETQDYSYHLLHDEIIALSKASVFDKDAATLVFDSTISEDNIKSRCDDLLAYVLDDKQDYQSALMRKFLTVNSVSGTIDSASVDIEVSNIDGLLQELGIQPATLGRILAMLDIYDYTWLSDGNADKLLSFTDEGFTYTWSAIGDYRLNLSGEPVGEAVQQGNKESSIITLDDLQGVWYWAASDGYYSETITISGNNITWREDYSQEWLDNFGQGDFYILGYGTFTIDHDGSDSVLLINFDERGRIYSDGRAMEYGVQLERSISEWSSTYFKMGNAYFYKQ